MTLFNCIFNHDSVMTS